MTQYSTRDKVASALSELEDELLEDKQPAAKRAYDLFEQAMTIVDSELELE